MFQLIENKQLVKLSTHGNWESGVKSTMKVKDFAPFVMDEPEELGGYDHGASPMEYVLAALSGCTSVMISLIAKEKNFSFYGVEFENVGILDLQGLMGVEGVSPHFQKIRFDVMIDTIEPKEQIQELKEIVEKRCPVFNLFKDAGVDITANWYRKQ